MHRSVKRGGLGFLAATPCLLWVTSWDVEEARYSPFTLEYQKRRSLVVLTGEVPLYRSRWETEANEVLAYVQREGFVAPHTNAPERWHDIHRLKTGHHGGWQRPYRGLQAKMVDWSERRPEVAKVFWPVGFRLIRSDTEQEVAAGYELLGVLWEEIETLQDLRGMLRLLELVYHVDIVSTTPGLPPAPNVEPRKQNGPGGRLGRPGGNPRGDPGKGNPFGPQKSSSPPPAAA